MDAVRTAVDRCKSLINTKDLHLKAAVDQISSAVVLLEASAPSRNTILKLAESLRTCLQPLFSVHLQTTLDYVQAVVIYVHNQRIVPVLRRENADPENYWGSLVSSLISSVIDYLEQHRTKKPRETVASAMHKTLCALYFGEASGLLAAYDGKLLPNVYLLLQETVEGPGADVAQLRDKHIGSRRLGKTIAEIRNYLALESILDLLARLIPPAKSGQERRIKFLSEVFDATLFKGSQRILHALETIPRDWSVMATKIIHILAETDIRFPQPFEVSAFEVESVSMTLADPLFVDKSCFVANLDWDGQIDSLLIPFSTVKSITTAASGFHEMKLSMKVNMPPIMGSSPMLLPQQDGYSVSFNISKKCMDNFGKTTRDRLLLQFVGKHKKLSKTPSELLPDIVKPLVDGTDWRIKAERLTNMAKHGAPDPVSCENRLDTSSPFLDPKPSPFLGGGNRDSNEPLEISSDEPPKAVFLDGDGNFSIHPPKRPIRGILTHGVDGLEDTTQPPVRADQDPSQDEVLSQPIPKHRRSRVRTIVVSDDDEILVNPKYQAVKEAKVDPKRISDEKEIDKLDVLDNVVEEVETLKRNIQTPQRKDPPARYHAARTKNEGMPTDPPADVKKRSAAQINLGELPPAKHARHAEETSHSHVIDLVKNSPRQFDPAAPKISGPFDYDEVPMARVDATQPRARAMKNKDGKRTVKPRLVKKNTKHARGDQRMMRDEEDDADKTLVEQTDSGQPNARGRRPVRASTVKGSTTSKSTASHKQPDHPRRLSKAPWEEEDFVIVKQEAVEDEIFLSYPAFDSLTEAVPLASDPSTSHLDTLVQVQVGDLSGDERDTKAELEGATVSSRRLSTPPAPQSNPERVLIDLTNSPDVQAEKRPDFQKNMILKTPSTEQKGTILENFATDRVAPVDRTRQNFAKKVERFPMPLSVIQETDNIRSSPCLLNVHNFKIEKFPDASPFQAFKGQPSKRDDDPKASSRRRAARGFSDDVELGTPRQSRDRVELGKTSKPDAQEHSRSREKQHQNVDDPDAKINAVLDEINRVLRQRIQRRFTNISNDLRSTRKAVIQEVVEKLRVMHHDGIRHYNKMVDLHDAYTEDSVELMTELEAFKNVTAKLAENYGDMLNDIRHNSLCRKFPKELVDLKLLDNLVPKIKAHL